MKFPQPVEAVLFDMDGLLVDTESVIATSFWPKPRRAAVNGIRAPTPQA